jgi:hypothetical protein
MPPQPHPVFRSPVDLAGPFTVQLRWDGHGEAADAVVVRYERTLALFASHLRYGAFLVPRGALPALAVEPSLTAQAPRFEIQFPCLPFQAGCLRLLLRALLYPHLIVGSEVEVALTGRPSPAGRLAGFSVRSPRDLEAPLSELPAPFAVLSRWCYKRINIELSFGGSVPFAATETMNQLVVDWGAFANLGAYAQVEQFTQFDPDEALELLVDPPAVGDDFMEWTVTRLEVANECVTALVNMLVRASASFPIAGVRIE